MATKEGDEAIEALRAVIAFISITDEGLERMGAEIDRLRAIPDWVPLAKAMFKVHGPATPDGAWFDYQAKAQLLIAAMQNQ